jgi:very-short-patch-repair endonuclease
MPTPAEAALWELLRRRQVSGAKFRRQHPLLGYVLDFYCPALKLAIELDGQIHDGGLELARDASRDRALAAYGATVLRFSNLKVLNTPDEVLAIIAAAVARAHHGLPR